MFNPIEGSVNFPQQELAVSQFWKEHHIYEKSLEQRQGSPSFVFYEGPPTANGMPHPGHCLTRAIKDLFPRYRTMRGYRCERKAGWDTHGLPVEVEVCKELGIHSKEEIEAHGIEDFIQKCQQSVWRYMREWERLTERIGFWVDLKNAYATYHRSFVESVWWSLKNLFDRGLLYQGHKIVWWWAQGGTALSSGEVGLGYREVADPSVYVKFPLLDDKGKVTDTSLLVWTTTPWTLPSNQFAAVHPNIEYVEVDLFREADSGTASGSKSKSHSGSGTGSKIGSWSSTATGSYRRSLLGNEDRTRVIVAKESLRPLADKFNLIAYQIVQSFMGYALIGKRYLPPFNTYFARSGNSESEMLLEQSPERDFFFDPEFKIPSHVSDAFFSKVTDYKAWRVVLAPFVTIDTGTGIVHQAPAFGEVDYDVLVTERGRFLPGQGPQLINCVSPDGKFTDEGPEYCRGRWVKECDKDIIRDLKQRGLLFHQEQYVHEYPFCWRAEQDPLIQYPRQSWFIRTSQFKDEMLANNAKINWLPEHIKTGRFGKFLETNVDWALSRERYWGTPLPIWKCDETGKMEAIASYDELMAKPGVAGGEVWAAAKKKNPELPDDLMVHKPYIDAVTYDSPYAKGARMRRVPEVIDCWYDSGAMPFAQWGYRGEPEASALGAGKKSPLPNPPHQGEGSEVAVAQKFHAQFPADFISEAIDQTRGWFYSQLAISTLMFGGGSPLAEAGSPARASQLASHPYPHPFRNCIVLGHMLGEDGQKMSKSKRNYREPTEIFDRYGADALRWYFFANQPPWTSIRYNEQAIKDSVPEFLLRLWNVFSFCYIYAHIDEFDPGKEGCRMEDAGGGDLDPSLFTTAKSYRPIVERGELDRWILSELNRTCATVVERMDAYDNFGACQRITEFVDALSNWYVRRSRDRFWAADKRAVEKLDAYWTLYETLVITARLIAPFVPFVAETIWLYLTGQDLNKRQKQVFSKLPGASESVHLCSFPTGNLAIFDQALSERMNLVRIIASLGRNARNAATLKVRQPLAKVEVILADTKHQAWLEQHADVIKEELNVKALEFCDDPSLYVEHEVVPNFKLLGPKLGKLLPKVKQWLGQQTGADLLANIRDNGQIDLTLNDQAIALTREEVEVRIKPKPGWTSANDQGVVVVLSTALTPELVAEGLARDVVRLIQDLRKDTGCEYTDRIEVGLVTDSVDLASAITQNRDYIAGETLANGIVDQPILGVEPLQAKLANGDLAIYVRVVK